MDDNLWLIELESALLEDCNVNEIFSICRGKSIPESLRPDVWQLCLDVRHKSDQMAAFNEIFDLPFQQQLRQDCDAFVDKLGNDDEERVSVVSDLESILTFYCKNRQLPYNSGNGWIELLLPLLSLKLSRSYTYNMFEAIRDTYIPKGCVEKGNVFHVFRLLILYHDPELCSLLDTKRISADQYAMSWFQSLFAATCPFSVVLSMWDQYFQHSDPFLVFFLSLIMLINGRDQIIAMKEEPKDAIVAFLANMPCALEPDDVVDFCALAQYYSLKTPSSFKTDYLNALFGNTDGSDTPDCVVSQALCLPVSVYELVENASADMPHPDAVRFFLVDCRPAEQYNVGHLSTAFHLDSNLMLQEPDSFATAVQGLLRAQKQAIEANSNAGGEHLCFMGSGRLEEDQYMHMAVASFLQKNTQYVSLLTGGYNSIHEYFGDHMADALEDHDPARCMVCVADQGNTNLNNNINAFDNSKRTPSTNQQQSGNNNDNVQLRNKPSTSTSSIPSTFRSSSDIFSKWSNVMKLKSAEVKGKLLDYIVNPSATSTAAAAAVDRHVLSSDRKSGGKLYRNQTPVFSIDEEHDEASLNELLYGNLTDETDSVSGAADQKEIVQLNAYLKAPDVIAFYKCREVHMNGYMYDSHLIVMRTHMVVLRDLEQKGTAQVIVRRPLSSIAKITSKKRHPDLITFKYGVTSGESLIITDMDRFLIPNATEATALVSKHIVKQLEEAGSDAEE